MADVIEFVETEESKATRAAVDRLVAISPDAAQKALREIIGWQERESIGSWRKTATPGGPVWAPNSPAWAEFKRVVLGQSPPQVGVFRGNLRQSVSSEMNEAALEGRVGAYDAVVETYAARFAAFRRFLPTVEYATRKAQEIVERTLTRTIADSGLEVTGAGV